MAFSFANVASAAATMGDPSPPGVQVKDGDELLEIQTGQLGFKTISGENKVKILPSPWPSDNPPIATAQLLSVASSQSIFAAAGPDTLVIASTDEVREVLGAREGDNIRNITPILTIPHDRLTHVAFSSDESVLVVSGSNTSGLLVYEVEKLRAGQNEVALRIPIDTSLRALVPNPNPESAHLFASVNSAGELAVADLSKGNFAAGFDGIVLAQDVASVSWSNKGKQLVAGTATGTAVQLKQDGSIVSNIPKSTTVPGDSYISTISWLEDNVFFIIYTPHSTSAEEGIPPSDYYIVRRSEKTNFTFHRLPEVLPPFGVERLPTHHFVVRLRHFEPSITDLLLLSATTATDIGIVSKSSQPLSASEDPAEQVTDTFTYTTLEDDTRRAALPLSDESLDTSPIGMALDLSSKEPVINPLPSDPEIQETAGPVPNLLVLNNEGLLCSWWVIYTDSIKQKTTFSGFEALKIAEQVRSAISASPRDETDTMASDLTSNTNPAAAPPPADSSTSRATPASQSSGFATSTIQSASTAPKLQSPQQSSFGTGNSFGSTSQIGNNKPAWTTQGFGSTPGTTNAGTGFSQSRFGKPAFGAPSSIGGSSTPAFGNRPTAFGQPSSPAFGKAGFGMGSMGSPLATTAATTGSTSGFASFATSGGFGAASDKKDQGNQSPFAKPAAGGGFASFANNSGFGSGSAQKPGNETNTFAKPASGGFGGFAQTSASPSPFIKPTGSSTFGQTPAKGAFNSSRGFGGFGTAASDNKSTFGAGTPFKVGSSFKGDGSAKDDLPASTSSNSFGFGSGLGNLLGESKKDVSPTQDTETEMDDDADQDSASDVENERPSTSLPFAQPTGKEPPKMFTTPPSTIAQSKVTPAAPVSSLFGPSQPQQTTTPQQPFTGFSFGSTTPKETPAAPRALFGANPVTGAMAVTAPGGLPTKFFSTDNETPDQKSISNSGIQRNTGSSEHIEKAQSSRDKDSKSISEPPLPPDPVSKPDYATGDTSGSSANSKISKEPNDAPLPPDFIPANKSAGIENVSVELPAADDDDEDDEDDDGDDAAEDDEEFSSDFGDSGEDVTEDISPVDEGQDEQDGGDTTDHIQTSPESSLKVSNTTSPTGGLFTKVSSDDISRQTRPLFGGPGDGPKQSRPLFGEVGQTMPMFPPPKPQQSPRSPSPVRPIFSHDTTRPDGRSVSAPLSQQSAINQRKAEYSQSPIAAQAAKARQEEAAREKTRLEAIKSQNRQTQAQELQVLEDDEDERIQRELASPVKPSDVLDEFITYQAENHHQSAKPDIPAQIERLYQDINSMICTMGINARSLSAFMMYQKERTKISDWLAVLQSDAPLDALDKAWSLTDIHRLHEGCSLLLDQVDNSKVQSVAEKLEVCQNLLVRDISDLRTKLTTIRKSLHARTHGVAATAPLSAEQASIQNDLRKASASVQTKLVQLEDTLGVIRARMTELAPSPDADRLASQNAQKKPTVEAVANTVAKMTSMAEKKSADIDVLEAQLRKLDVSFNASTGYGGQLASFSTPQRSKVQRVGGTPSSVASSVFYTPDSKIGASARSTRSTGGNNLSAATVSAEDRERWQARSRRKKDVAATLRAVLEERKKNSAVAA